MQTKRLFKKGRHEKGRDGLMKAALHVLSRKGFEDTSVEDVCLAAGYSKGGFYFHFRSKDDMLIQLIEETIGRQSEGEAMLGEGWPPSLLLELWAQAFRKRAIREPLTQHYASRLESLRQSMESTQHPMTTDPDAAVDLILALESGLMIQSQIMPSGGHLHGAQGALEVLVPAAGASSIAQASSTYRQRLGSP